MRFLRNTYYFTNSKTASGKKFVFPFLVTSLVRFIGKLFLYEVLMDLAHYAMHRLAHSNGFLYYWSGHKRHHAITSLSALATFCHDPVDLFMTNFIPTVFSTFLLHKALGVKFTQVEFQLALGYKTWIEVAGHTGDVAGRSTSFPIFVYLPRLLNMELRTKGECWFAR